MALITKAGGPDAFCSDSKNQEKYPKFCKKVMDLIVQVSLRRSPVNASLDTPSRSHSAAVARRAGTAQSVSPVRSKSRWRPRWPSRQKSWNRAQWRR